MFKKQNRKIFQGIKVTQKTKLPCVKQKNVHDVLRDQQKNQQQKFKRQFYRYSSAIKKQFPLYFDKQKILDKEKMGQKISNNFRHKTKSLPVLDKNQLKEAKQYFDKYQKNGKQIFPVEFKHFLLDKYGFDKQDVNRVIGENVALQRKKSFYQQRLSKVYPVNQQDDIEKQFMKVVQKFKRDKENLNINIKQTLAKRINKDIRKHRDTLLNVMENYDDKQIEKFVANEKIDFNLQKNQKNLKNNENLTSYHDREELKNSKNLQNFEIYEKKVEKFKQIFQNEKNEIFSYGDRYKYKPPFQNTFVNIKRQNENEFKIYNENKLQNLDQFRTLPQKQESQIKKEKLTAKLQKISVNKFKETKLFFQQLIYGIYTWFTLR